ncbi:expressed unknown protein [Seminavis robusta]|uniref:Uncharacterized protein n=1 Tax=Seminavis robusta TaxID=568900 RepID=A0A9N8EP97_9STRA|nr:expressed unknown protein [Seminavis robusta]|eukprot:Sro1583_g283900.1 n/a (220) ;mRNA; r:2536-3195
MPLPGDQTNSTIAYFILMPIVFLPILYVGWVALVITRGGLLPQSGRTREIALFFFRIFLVLVIMWLPTLISLMVGIASHWVFYFVGIWAHLTGSVTSIFSLCKSDIRQATMALLCCQVRQVNGEFDNSMNGTSRRQRISQDHNVLHNNRCSSGSTSKRWSSLWLRFSRKATLPEEEPTIDNGEGVGTLEDGAMETKICNGNDADGEDGNATKSERVGSG